PIQDQRSENRPADLEILFKNKRRIASTFVSFSGKEATPCFTSQRGKSRQPFTYTVRLAMIQTTAILSRRDRKAG
ncbi:MAG: hypothetical protein VXX11_06630, partial [Planctomycetota bacterium]|nr:hypothetical protein [Planctomycetota bacterium]